MFTITMTLPVGVYKVNSSNKLSVNYKTDWVSVQNSTLLCRNAFICNKNL